MGEVGATLWCNVNPTIRTKCKRDGWLQKVPGGEGPNIDTGKCRDITGAAQAAQVPQLDVLVLAVGDEVAAVSPGIHVGDALRVP